ncbi:MAG TPA: chitobiase/beta-hexosaminidase C-terminal domain-containing protein [Steroidobacteraceae bacterium]|nr:chitobiase/beta-hexosaminidase C-terminal domain-containing protein [Steroidobacteraceae bacterium]
MSFSIRNKPAWAAFSSKTGSLSGTPAASNVGADNNIEINAATSASSATLPAFTITVSAAPPPPPTIATSIFSFANFASNPSTINLGDAEGVVSGAIQLAGNQVHDAGQAWYVTKQNITSFTTDFTFKITSNGYGICFVIQNDPRGFGAGGDSNGLGYFAYSVNPAGTAIGNSIAIAFNATPNGSSGSESYTGAAPSMTGLYLDGGLLMDNGIMPVQDLIPQGINLQSGDVVSAHVVYDGALLSMALTDTVTGKQAYFQWPVNIPAVVGGDTAYIGFSGGTINPVPLLVDSWSWWQGYNTRVASPTFSPAPGAYTSSQSVTLSAPAAATIYYTTNGKPPTTASSVYSGPITVSSNEIVQAIAVESGYTSSEPAQGNYQIQAAGSPVINFASGFAGAGGLMLNAGTATLAGSDLQLTDKTNSIEIGSGFYAAPVNVRSFTTQFTLQFSGGGDQNTLLFVIQNQTPASADNTGLPAVSGGPYAFGFENYGINTPDGGYAGISTSVGVKFDTWNGGTTGLFTNGETPYEPQTTITGIDLTSGHPIACTLSYDGATLTLSMKDTVTTAKFSKTWSVDIPSEVGADTAYVGFTASLYTGPSQQDVTAWTFAND